MHVHVLTVLQGENGASGVRGATAVHCATEVGVKDAEHVKTTSLKSASESPLSRFHATHLFVLKQVKKPCVLCSRKLAYLN